MQPLREMIGRGNPAIQRTIGNQPGHTLAVLTGNHRFPPPPKAAPLRFATIVPGLVIRPQQHNKQSALSETHGAKKMYI